MGVSRATFGRIVEQARKTVADALIHGKAINVEGGNYERVDSTADRAFQCDKCDFQWKEPRGTGRPKKCPSCGRKDFHRLREKG
jgi:rubrerythrin